MKTSFDKFMASNAVQEVSNVELGAVKIDLALFDDIEKARAGVSKMIGFVNGDFTKVQQAVSLVGKIKNELPLTDKLADALLDKVLLFENEAKKLGVDLPNQVVNAGNLAFELKKTNDKLRKLIGEKFK
jgi:hypothetical protein